MIIISQDKNTIVNFDNITKIGQGKGKIGINDNALNNNLQVIGKYKTEERAKEVLQEITERYSSWENFKAGCPEGICRPNYEMPEE